jgi:hypothetical protein
MVWYPGLMIKITANHYTVAGAALAFNQVPKRFNTLKRIVL